MSLGYKKKQRIPLLKKLSILSSFKHVPYKQKYLAIIFNDVYLFVYVYTRVYTISVCICVFVCAHKHTCTSVEARYQPELSSSLARPLRLWRQGLSNWHSLILQIRFLMGLEMWLNMGSEPKLRSSWLHDKHFMEKAISPALFISLNCRISLNTLLKVIQIWQLLMCILFLNYWTKQKGRCSSILSVLFWV